MRERIKERANQLRVAAGHHETAADSLARHLTEVDARKDRSFQECLDEWAELTAGADDLFESSLAPVAVSDVLAHRS